VKLPRIYWLDACIWGALVALAVMFVSRKFSGPREGVEAALFDLPLVGAADGKRFRLEEQRGKPVLIEVFAGWCGACKRSSPALVEAYKRNAGVSFLGVSMDGSPSDALRVKQDWGIPYDVAHDDGSVAKGYDIEVLPTFILIGKDGIVRRVSTGVASPKEVTGWLSEL
jgi:thiol-disulfide isomerase/thioredoxin